MLAAEIAMSSSQIAAVTIHRNCLFNCFGKVSIILKILSTPTDKHRYVGESVTHVACD